MAMAQKILAFYLFTALLFLAFGVPTPFSALIEGDSGGIIHEGNCTTVFNNETGNYDFTCAEDGSLVAWLSNGIIPTVDIEGWQAAGILAAGIGLTVLTQGAILPYLLFVPFIAYLVYFFTYPISMFNTMIGTSGSSLAMFAGIFNGIWLISTLYLAWGILSWWKGNE